MGPDDHNYTPTVIAAPLGGRYQIIKSLGAGSFGQTFLAADLHLPGQPQCVVKQLQPTVRTEASLQTARRLFETEAKVLGRLGENAQIPRLLAHFEEKEEFYLVQELIEGQDLSAELPTAQNPAGQHWTDDEAIAFLYDLLNTLSFVHTNSVIHRDIKPSNLIRRQSDRRIVLIDFGAVKQVGTQLVVHQPGTNPNASQINPPRTIAIGTEGYMPPEQVSGHPQFSSDLYATGMIAIQGLTGRYPGSLERNTNTGEIDWHHLSPQVYPKLKALIDNMVRYDFRTRYGSAPTALTALKALPSELLRSIDLPEPLAGTTPPAGSSVAAEPITATSTVAAASSLPNNLDNTQTISPNENIKEASAAKSLLLPFGIGIAIAAMLGVGVVAGQRLPDLFGRSDDEQEFIDEEAAAKEAAEKEAAEKEAAEREAVTNIERLYGYISAKEWQQAEQLFSPELAERFEPEFFQKFEQVTVENLQVTYQTDEVIDLVGQNTYVYPLVSVSFRHLFKCANEV